jgi:hypothetical protein
MNSSNSFRIQSRRGLEARVTGVEKIGELQEIRLNEDLLLKI